MEYTYVKRAMELVVENLSCYVHQAPLFEGLNFTLHTGEALLVRGQNGAGKTSLLNLVCGLSFSPVGKILFNHISIQSDPQSYYKNVAYLGHKNALQPALTVKDNLRLMASMEANQIHQKEALKTIDFPEKLMNQPVKNLSQGQKRRLALVRVLSTKKKIWILDEPTNGLDGETTTRFVTCLAQHLGKGGIAIIATHDPLSLPHAKELDLDAYGKKA